MASLADILRSAAPAPPPPLADCDTLAVALAGRPVRETLEEILAICPCLSPDFLLVTFFGFMP